MPESSSEGPKAAASLAAEECAALRKSEAMLRSVVMNTPDYMTVIGRDHRVIFVNRPSEHRDPVGQLIEDFVPREERDKVAEAIEHVFRTGEATSYDSDFEIKGELRHFTNRVRAIVSEVPPEEGAGLHVDRVVLTSTETTEQAQATQQRERVERERVELASQLHQAQKMEAIGQLTGGIAHDFNNLLTILLGSLEALGLDDRIVGDSRALVDQASEACLRGASLTARLLAFSKRQTLTPQVSDAAELVQGMVEFLERAVPDSLRVEVGALERGLRIDVDRAQLDNAVLNLVLNAKDAMGGQGTVRLSCFRALPEHGLSPAGEPGLVALAVQDEGEGMPPEVQARVFEPFFTTKGRDAGSGLGLSMVHGFATQSRGDVRVHSVPGKGTTMTLLFPEVQGELAPDSSVSESLERVPQGHGEVLFLVEDNDNMRTMLERQLRNLGYVVETAATGEAALALLNSRPRPALVVSDYLLGEGLNGVDVIRALRAKYPQVPALLVSGYTDLHQEPGALAEVQATFLAKPFKAAQLARAIAAAFESPPSEA